MESPTSIASPELARVVWASHILSYMNPYTETISNKDHLQKTCAGLPLDADSDEEADSDEDVDAEILTQDTDLLTPHDTNVRKKFLNGVAELLSHSKGGATVTAAALRESEDLVEVDLSRNAGFRTDDEEYLSSLTGFLAAGSSVDAEARRDETIQFLHSFIAKTIDYNASRLDSCIQKTQCLVKRVLIPLPVPERLASGPERPCLLGCCAAAGISTPAAVQSLFWKIRSFNMLERDSSRARTDRREMVALASGAIRSPDSARIQLGSLAPSVDSSKLLLWWKQLARPVTILRTLVTITQLLPNFRTIRFIPLKVPPLIKLGSHQIPSIAEAWQNLGLPCSLNAFIPASASRKTRYFRDDCSRQLHNHCEIQLLMRYEADPSLAPTLAYFGCSKKACFLCDEFIALSPLKPGVRGRHGVCHPNWAVSALPPGSGITARDRLNKLCNVIRRQIQLLLQPGPRSPPNIVYQSSAVSDLKTADMIHLTHRAADRETVEKAAKEYREKMQILLDPRSQRPQEIYCRDIRTLCVMCQWPGRRCCGCFAISYCSKRCQTIDWPSHKILCRKFVPFLEARPSEDFRVGIYFPRDQGSPRLVWVPFEHTEGPMYQPFFDHFLGSLPFPERLLWTLPFRTNKRRGIDLGYWMTIYYADYDKTINKSVHRAVEACIGMTVPKTTYGNYVVMNGPSHRGAAEHSDMTLMDFRYTLDFFSTYFDDTIHDIPSQNSVRALKICSPLEHELYGRETFASVWVDRDFNGSMSDVSDLSMALIGFEIRVCQVRETEMERQSDAEAEGGNWENPYAKALMLEIDPFEERWGISDNWNTKGSAILLREDRQNLDTELVEVMCRYCVEVLQPLFEKSRNGEVSRSEVLAEISKEKLTAWVNKEGDRRREGGQTIIRT